MASDEIGVGKNCEKRRFSTNLLPRDAMHKRGICRHPGFVRHVRELRQND